MKNDDNPRPQPPQPPEPDKIRVGIIGDDGQLREVGPLDGGQLFELLTQILGSDE